VTTASYAVGIDAGTTRTAAALSGDGDPQAVQLGAQAFTVPTTVAVTDTGELEIGDAAERVAVRRPHAVARYFKARVGDDVPVLLGGAPWAPALLLAKVQRWAYDQAAALRPAPPAATVLTHPAGWGTYRLDVLRQAAIQSGIPEPILLSEPAAAATHCGAGQLAVGATVAVYDFGGGTFDAAVVRREADGFAVLGKPQGIERVGGLNVDEAVLAFVGDALDGALEQLGEDDVADVVELRRRCSMAKEALADEATTSVPVRLRHVQTDVRITRDDLREMVQPLLAETVTALRRSLESAGVSAADLEQVLLVGGSSRLPLVSETLSAALDGVPVVAEPQPKLAIALGAARHGHLVLHGPATPAPPEPPAAAPAPAPAPAVVTPPPAPQPAPPATAAPAPAPVAVPAAQPAPAPAPVGAPAPAAPEPARPAPGGAGRIGLLLGSIGLFALGVAVALAGIGTAPEPPPADTVAVDGQDAAGDVDIDLGKPLIVEVAGPAASVVARPRVGEVALFESDAAPVENGAAVVDLRNNRLLVGGRFRLEVDLLGADGAVVDQLELDATTSRNGFLTVPGGEHDQQADDGHAAGEAVLRSIRRSRSRKPGDVVRLCVIGAALGVLVVSVVGLLGRTEPSLPTAAVVAVLTALAAALLGSATQRWRRT
jgi:molecular chaperone DnaK